MNEVNIRLEKNVKVLNQLQRSQITITEKLDTFDILKAEVENQSEKLADLGRTTSLLNIDLKSLDDKMVNVIDKTCDIEVEMLKQKKCFQNDIQAVSNQAVDVEYELASHIETVKNNMEMELRSTNQNQFLLENKLSDFTREIQKQNAEMNNKIQNLRDDFQHLKTESVRAEEISISNASSYSNLSSQNSYSTGVRCTCSVSSGSETSNDHGKEALYMFGDITKTLIIDGIAEKNEEILGEVILKCINEIGITLVPDDIESVYRIGTINPNRKWPRPVKLTLKDQTKRDLPLSRGVYIKKIQEYGVVGLKLGT